MRLRGRVRHAWRRMDELGIQRSQPRPQPRFPLTDGLERPLAHRVTSRPARGSITRAQSRFRSLPRRDRLDQR